MTPSQPGQVTLYTTRWCGFCRAAKRLLDRRAVPYDEVDLTEHPDRRGLVMKLSGQRTVPQIWIGETHVGGFDDLNALQRRGELDALLEREGVQPA